MVAKIRSLKSSPSIVEAPTTRNRSDKVGEFSHGIAITRTNARKDGRKATGGSMQQMELKLDLRQFFAYIDV